MYIIFKIVVVLVKVQVHYILLIYNFLVIGRDFSVALFSVLE